MNTYKIRSERKLQKTWGWYLFILIPIIGTLSFNYYPIFINFFSSLKNNSGAFIGTTNYEVLFSDALFWISVKNTIYMGILTLLINIHRISHGPQKKAASG